VGLSLLGTWLTSVPPAAAQTTATRQARATSVTAPATAVQTAAVRPELVSKAAQLQLPAKQPGQLRVEPVGAAQQAPAVTARPAGGTTIAVRLGEQLLIREPAEAVGVPKAIALAEKVKAPLPSTLVVGVRDPENGMTVARQFQPFLTALVSPLRWDTEAKSYVTTVLVGLDPLPGEAEGGPVQLPAPIRFQLSGENIEKVEPPDVDISEAGTNGYRRFTVLTTQFERPIRVTAHSRFGDKLYEASVDPGPTFIRLGQSTTSVDGFGLGQATISVSRHAANTQLLPSPSDLRVQLKTSHGFLAPSHVDLAAKNATGETSLVSSTWGEAVVTETSADVRGPSSVTVAFAFPVLKFVLGLLGAASAGALRVLTRKRAKRQAWAPVFVGCIASGITVDILVALGAPIAPEWLLGLIRSELAWFAIGLIAGYPGVAVVAWLGDKLFDFKRGEEPASSSA
jgi:hypothetical protein